jgi:hypothetical protein
MWFSLTEQNWFLGMMNQLGNQFLAYHTRPNDRIAQEAWSIAFNFDTQQTMRQFATPPSPLFLSHTHMDTCLRITLENTNILAQNNSSLPKSSPVPFSPNSRTKTKALFGSLGGEERALIKEEG